MHYHELPVLPCALLFALLLRYFVRHINRNPVLKVGPVIFFPSISRRTLNLALCKDPQLLGSSPSGNYYKTVLENGLNVAVKRLGPFSCVSSEAHSKKKILQELSKLACLRQRNLMSLRAYVFESGVYSLALFEHHRRASIHRNVFRTPGTLIKADIYSFGMILGVLLTGRDPNDTSFGSMGEWLRQIQQEGEAREALDKRILDGKQVEQDEMLMALRIDVVCLSDLPADRPSSDELLSMLTQLNSF
ncbi:Inactive leucine-rich repeat receptor-like protein kinase CORYNE [Striga hermonthica]|uniref:Inactive leucine-rich repeat receptor-like protein kinase CORYNE n=1 Tax=Striga hermonthica TaxID=68872 RepID=A0A9N7RJD5_STRHE|nr:Inactive leucine-rich repeat receptor-like protein kinase CORYNE [Striga hermonthica]